MAALDSDSCVIIAEAGVNHNGSLAHAIELANAAHRAGADFVKFQTFDPSLVASRGASAAGYQIRAGYADQQSMLERFVLGDSEHRELKSHCAKLGIGFSSTAHDLDSADYLETLGQDFVKIGSGDITNWQLLEKVAGFRKTLVVSTGASQLDEVQATMLFLEEIGVSVPREVVLMQCTSAYPAPLEDAHVRVLTSYRDQFGCRVGYSDHTQTTESALAAVALGARVIEKHITLDRNMEGPDHLTSLEPLAFGEYVESIRKTEKALGNSQKSVAMSEAGNRPLIRKSLYARKPIARGERFDWHNVVAKRPAGGLSADAWPRLKGQISPRSYEVDEPIESGV